jgi:parallel beta-helix repeat protein
VDGATGVVVRGLAIVDAKTSGVWLKSGSGAILEGLRVVGAQGGGVRVDDSATSDLAPTIANNALSGNADFGVGIFGSVAIIDTNNITGTIKGAVGGYGILAANYEGELPSSVTISGNTVDANSRAGIVLTSGTKALIDTNNINGNGAA